MMISSNGRPAEVLGHVQDGRRVRAAPAERRAQQHHPGHARVRSDRAGQSEQDVPGDRADRDREHRLRQREHRHEPGGRDDHEQADRRVSPEQRQVEEAEHAQALRHGRDPPTRRLLLLHPLPSLVRARSGSTGVISAACRGTPGPALYPLSPFGLGLALDYLLQLALLHRGGQRGDRAEADEDRAGDVPLQRREAAAAAESLAERPGHERPRTVAEEAERGEEQAEREDLQPGRAAARIDELRQEGRKNSAVFGLSVLTTIPWR
jgi:hypothetical protein